MKGGGVDLPTLIDVTGQPTPLFPSELPLHPPCERAVTGGVHPACEVGREGEAVGKEEKAWRQRDEGVVTVTEEEVLVPVTVQSEEDGAGPVDKGRADVVEEVDELERRPSEVLSYSPVSSLHCQ